MKFAFAGKHTFVMTNYIKTENGQWQFQSYWEATAAVAAYEDLLAHCEFMGNLVSEKWAPLATEATEFVGTKIVQYSGGAEMDAYKRQNIMGEITDGDGELAMPDSISLVIQRRTANNERHKRGRMFIPGMAEDINDNGRLSDDFTAAAGQLANVFSASHVSGATTFNARHWDRKTPDATVVTHARAMLQLAIRKNRSIRYANLPV